MYVMNNPTNWEDYLHLEEFAYKNGYQTSSKMSPFEVLYGRKCRTLVTWDIPVDHLMLGHELLKDLEQLVTKVQVNLKEAQDRHKSYTDKKRKYKDYQIGDHVYLKVKEKRSSLSLGRCGKLAPRFFGPFEILAKRGQVAYELALPAHIRFHNFFHASLLKKYVYDTKHVIDWSLLQVEPKGEFSHEPLHILQKREVHLRKCTIVQLKVQ